MAFITKTIKLDVENSAIEMYRSGEGVAFDIYNNGEEVDQIDLEPEQVLELISFLNDCIERYREHKAI